MLFPFERWEKACRYCVYLGIDTNEKKVKYFSCGTGQYTGGKSVLQMPTTCVMYKRGREKMSYVNLKQLSEEQLRLELEKIRAGRVGIGRKRRTESRERRISDGKKSKKTIEPAERITIQLD